MFTFLAKSVNYLTKFPKTVLGFFLVLTIATVYFIPDLRWELQLEDSLPAKSKLKQAGNSIEESFGGMGSLTIVIQSPDSLENYKFAKSVSEALRADSAVHFVDFESNIEFFQKHKLAFITEQDLDTVITRVEGLKKKYVLEQNPFFVNIEEDSKDSVPVQNTVEAAFKLDDLENKYFSRLNKSHSNQNGTIRVIDVYPTESLTNLPSSRVLFNKVKKVVSENNPQNKINIYYTGKLYDVVQSGNTLLSEAKKAGKYAGIFILLLLIIHFYKQPQLILVSAIPIAIPVCATLAMAQILYGRINLFSIILGIILPGQACQIIIHVLNRYFHERSRKLGPSLSIESAILGIGPSTATSAFILASIFITCSFLPLEGLHELGVLGAFGTLLNWFCCTLLTFALLKFAQRKKPFDIYELEKRANYTLTLLSYKTNWIILGIIIVVSLAGLFYGSHTNFLYDFKQTEFQKKDTTADSLIAQTGFPQYDPIIVQFTSPEKAEEFYSNYAMLKSKGQVPSIDRVYTLRQVSPKVQKEKQEKLHYLEDLITPGILQNMDSTERFHLEKITREMDEGLFEELEMPEEIQSKFKGKNGAKGMFGFIFPKINPDNGEECRMLAKDVEKLEDYEKDELKFFGTTLVRAQILDLILPHILIAILVGYLLFWFILLLFYNRFSRALFTLLPSIFALSWLLVALKFLDIEISLYSVLAFPLLIGVSVDGSLQLWASYYEKQEGTALTVFRNKFSSIVLSQMASLVGTYGLIISSHPGVKSIGTISLIGLICVFISQYTIFPLIAGTLDNYRLYKKKLKEQHD